MQHNIKFILSLFVVFFVWQLTSLVLADGELGQERPLGSGSVSPGNVWDKLSNSELAKYTQCDSDQDCLIANNGCCDCANGGEDIAINKNMLNIFKAKFKCDDVVCGEKVKIPACASGVVSCVGHSCKYFSLDQLSGTDGDLIEGLKIFRNNGGDVYPVELVG